MGAVSEYYLIEYPNPCLPQKRTPRRQALSGVVAVHSVESIIDRVGPDYGAENAASYIGHRCTYGSYHVIVDSDSYVLMAPDNYETWNVAQTMPSGYGHNSHIWGISFACSTTDFNPSDQWTISSINTAGMLIAEFWKRNGLSWLAENPRWVTKAEADYMTPGLILHGTVQPSDRSDAWKYNPHRPTLDLMLVDSIRRHAGGTSTPIQGDLMAADAQAILDKLQEIQTELNATKAEVADALVTIGAWENDTRRYEGRIPVKVAGDPRQYLVQLVANPDHDPSDPESRPMMWAKAHVTDQELLGILHGDDTLQDIGPPFIEYDADSPLGQKLAALPTVT